MGSLAITNFFLHIKLPPTAKLRQGNVFTPVCHSVHKGEWQTPLGKQPSPKSRHPPGQTPPREQTPPRSRHVPPGADTAWQIPPRSRHTLGRQPLTPPGSKHPPPHGADTPQEQTPPCTVHPGRYGQQAGGTHPTGMHTC